MHVGQDQSTSGSVEAAGSVDLTGLCLADVGGYPLVIIPLVCQKLEINQLAIGNQPKLEMNWIFLGKVENW